MRSSKATGKSAQCCETERYAEGFLCGQAQAYCDQLRFGSRVAAQMDFPGQHFDSIAKLVAGEGFRLKVVSRELGRVTLWIFSSAEVESLIDSLNAAPHSLAATWAMGKLFGYSDSEVLAYLRTEAT